MANSRSQSLRRPTRSGEYADSPQRGRVHSERGMIDSLQRDISYPTRSSNRSRDVRYADRSGSSSSSSSEEEIQQSIRSTRSRSGTTPAESSGTRSRLQRHFAHEEVEEEDDDEEEEEEEEQNHQSSNRYESRSRLTRNSTPSTTEIPQALGGRYPRRSRSHLTSSSIQKSEEQTPSWMNRRGNSSAHSSDGRNLRRSSRYASRSDEEEGAGEEQEEDGSDDEEEEEEEEGKTYSLRDRGLVKRETMNVQNLGGDGGGYKRSAVSRRGVISYRDPQSKIRLGRRTPRSPDRRGSHGSRKHRRHHRHDEYERRHFDSSSESSSSSSSGGSRGRKDRGRSHHGGGFGDHDDGGGAMFRGSATGEDDQFQMHERERMERELDSIRPINLGSGGAMGGSVMDKASKRDISRADVNPIGVDPKIGFDSVGGLDGHIRALKEMVVLPLLYPDLFAHFDTQPPRGVLFIGPPGTGKTLTARALANSLSPNAATASGPDGHLWGGGRKVSFFMRKGADCLSKWVGEGERQLRLLFEQAKRYQPSIVFFDEIDGLAPVRSSKQDQIHSSIVSTLLALMDGLDSRGQVVVIGATNRPDAIDPALRRPGRFDRELLFPLPDSAARASILDIHTNSWNPPLAAETKQFIVENTVGYCGADMKALCAEACLVALRRTYPQVYESAKRLQLDTSQLLLGRGDFAAALQRVIPASKRSNVSPGKPLDPLSAPLLQSMLDSLLSKIRDSFPIFAIKSDGANQFASSDTSKYSGSTNRLDQNDLWISCLTDVQDASTMQSLIPSANISESLSDGNRTNYSSTLWNVSSILSNPRVLIIGSAPGMGQSELASAALHKLEEFPVFSLDFSTLVVDSNHFSPEQALMSRINEACKAAPAVIYLPDVVGWWRSASDSLRSALLAGTASVNRSIPLLWMSTASWEQNISDSVSSIASPGRGSVSEYVSADEDVRLKSLLSWLAGLNSDVKINRQLTIGYFASSPNVLQLRQPPLEARRIFFSNFFTQFESLPSTIYAARKKMLMSLTNRLEVDTSKEDEDTELEKKQESERERLTTTLVRSLFETPVFDSESIEAGETESDRNTLREFRLFMRAALAELMKEKRLAPLMRPVDAELVPDYYDIVRAPMDLETMRMKVDDGMYPTYRSFIYDLEQIGFNALEYNPLDGKDSRGRQIVLAAKSLLDIIETHAYNFKRRIKHDIFKKCEAIWHSRPSSRCRHVLDSQVLADILDKCDKKSKNDINLIRSTLPRENEKYYKEVFKKHEELKTELGEEHPSFGMTFKYDTQSGSIRSLVDAKIKEPPKLSIESAGTRRSSRGKRDSAEFISLEDVEGILKKRRRAGSGGEAEADAAQEADTVTTTEPKGNMEVADSEDNERADDNNGVDIAALEEFCADASESPAEVDATPVPEKSIEERIAEDAILSRLLVAVESSSSVEQRAKFSSMVDRAVKASQNWSYNQLITHMTDMIKISWDFQKAADWESTVKAIEAKFNLFLTDV